MAKALSRLGCVVVRFNFRGVGDSAGTFDNGAGEADDFRAVLDYAADQYPRTEIYAAGYSFGAWVALTTGAIDPRVTLLLGVAPPLHRDLGSVQACKKSKFLIHGERDELAPLKEMWKFYGSLPEPKELVVIDAADHMFDGRTSEVGDAVVDLLEDFEP
jgi:alpha/beta superfamily hydrolase